MLDSKLKSVLTLLFKRVLINCMSELPNGKQRLLINGKECLLTAKIDLWQTKRAYRNALRQRVLIGHKITITSNWKLVVKNNLSIVAMATMTIQYAKILVFKALEKNSRLHPFFLFHKTFVCATVHF